MRCHMCDRYRIWLQSGAVESQAVLSCQGDMHIVWHASTAPFYTLVLPEVWHTAFSSS